MRSLLFVPAIEKMMSKIASFSADTYIVDLEDSIVPEKKETALKAIQSFLTSKPHNVYIRLDGNLMKEELSVLKDYEFEGYMIPKFEDPDDYEESKPLTLNKKIIALVETPKGIINIERIASCEWVDAIAFGAEDFTSSMGMINQDNYLIGVRMQMVLYAKACNKPVFDSPSFALDDPQKFREQVQMAQEMGFDGKMAINPNQIAVIDEVFNACDEEYMRGVIEQYEKSGEAVVKINGKVYEKMHINHFKRILRERI